MRIFCPCFGRGMTNRRAPEHVPESLPRTLNPGWSRFSEKISSTKKQAYGANTFLMRSITGRGVA
jgi:hypothetical protein